MLTNSAVDYGYLRQLVFSQSQNVLDASRDYLFETRLASLVRNQRMTGLEELVEHLRQWKSPALEQAIAEAMTINETSFFRDGKPFDLLRSTLLPELIERRRHCRTLRLWSAACSSGQESYSIAMTIDEHFPQLGGWNVRVEGTDFCGEMIQRARRGAYRRIEMNRGLPAGHVASYFDHAGEEWVVRPAIRRMCNFRQANLCHTPLPFSSREPFDVIFVRNVMLYFSVEARRALLAGMHRLLAPDGVLFLGSSEQPADLSRWSAVLAGGTCHYRPRQGGG